MGGLSATAAATVQDCYFEPSYARFNKSEEGTAGMTPATSGHTFFTEGELRDVGYIGGDQSSWWTADIGTSVQVFYDWDYKASTVHTRIVKGEYGLSDQVVAAYSGLNSKTVGAAAGDIIESVTRMRGDLTTQTAAMTTARAYLDFDNPPDGWGVYGPLGQRWRVTLDDGYVLDCGN